MRGLGPPLSDALRLLAPLAPTLEVLTLGNNPLGGALGPDDVAPFTRLTFLRLDNTGLEGARETQRLDPRRCRYRCCCCCCCRCPLLLLLLLLLLSLPLLLLPLPMPMPLPLPLPLLLLLLRSLPPPTAARAVSDVAFGGSPFPTLFGPRPPLARRCLRARAAGEVPRALPASLERLRLGFNDELTGLIPPEWGERLTRLRELSLRSLSLRAMETGEDRYRARRVAPMVRRVTPPPKKTRRARSLSFTAQNRWAIWRTPRSLSLMAEPRRAV